MSREIVSLETLKERFGGGYEIVYQSGSNQFRKLSDVLFCIHSYWAVGDDMYSQLVALFRYSYFDEHLLIRSLDWNEGGESIEELHIMAPMYYEGSREYWNTIPLPTYESELVVQISMIKTPGGQVLVDTQLNWRRNAGEIVQVREKEGGSFDVTVSLWVIEQIVERTRGLLGL
jgi:hypothetical protein